MNPMKNNMNPDFSKTLNRNVQSFIFLITILILVHTNLSAQDNLAGKVKFIDFYYENASPLIWNAVGDTAIKVDFLYDYERGSLNRQSTHFNFKVIAEPGTKLNLILSGFRNIYNGRINSSYGRIPNQNISCYFSEDYINWQAVETSPVSENNFDLQVKYTMKTNGVFVAKLPVYSIKQLDQFKSKISSHPQIKIIPIGHTVEKRPLEIIRVGNPDARRRILIRARAHAWEPGGNWVIEGLVDGFFEKEKKSSAFAGEICYYILPMANKDMTARGMTRFNLNGLDLNRGWGSEADSVLNPENYFLEEFVKRLIAENGKPDFLVDLHNDDYGNVHVSKPKDGDANYLKNIERFFHLLEDKTWFSGKMQKAYEENPERFTIAAGLYERYNITGCIFELNGDRIEKLKKMPSSDDWKFLGERLNDVFENYFE